LDLKEFREENWIEHLVPNQILGFLEFQGEREKGGSFYFQELAKVLLSADSKKLKMHRSPLIRTIFSKKESCKVRSEAELSKPCYVATGMTISPPPNSDLKTIPDS